MTFIIFGAEALQKHDYIKEAQFLCKYDDYELSYFA